MSTSASSSFFFQAEDGIRDHCVTGVQTCALPISRQEVVLPLCAWLGQNIRFVLLGVAAVAAHISAFLWAEAVWMSLVLVALLWIHEWNATALGDLLDGERNSYARIT